MQDKKALKSKPPSYCNVVTGKQNLNSEDEEDYLVSSISKFIMHPNWKPSRQSYDADIAFAVLENPIKFNYNMRPLCLPVQQDSDDIINQKGILGGYDEKFDSEIELTTRHLKVNEICIISEDQCLDIDTSYDRILTHRTFCSSEASNSDSVKGEL